MKQDKSALDLDLLSALGFGPEALLVDEPRLFFDRRLLASLVLELEGEFEGHTASALLYQIGLLQGLRDAGRIVHAGYLGGREEAERPVPEATALAIRMGSHRVADGGHFEIPGYWPERFEADARLGRIGESQHPSCWLSAGYTSGWLSGILDAEMLVLETECCARGDEQCRFVARELATWRSDPHPVMDPLIEATAFDSLWEAAMRSLPDPSARPTRPAAPPLSALDRESIDVHVWGPVMVLPFADADSVLETVDRLGRDPNTAPVRVVVLDLRNRVLDESFDCAALEVVLEAVETWGAETIVTGVSPLSEGVIAQLEASHLLLRKNVAEAVTAAFQIADAQRHLL